MGLGLSIHEGRWFTVGETRIFVKSARRGLARITVEAPAQLEIKRDLHYDQHWDSAEDRNRPRDKVRSWVRGEDGEKK